MTNQSKIDDLTKRLQKGNEDLSAELQNESAEIQAAIGSSKINTSAFEAEIAKTEGLREDVKNLFTPDAEEAPAADEPATDAPVTDETSTDEPVDEEA
ncbi:MAG: hypothetical protein ACR2MD_03180 [Aridibacter sp.]